MKQRHGGDLQELSQLIADEKLNIYVARMIHEARTEAGLSRMQLAELIGTKQQAIARLEDANYDGHSLSMLQRIADALGKKLAIAFVEEHAYGQEAECQKASHAADLQPGA